MGTLTLENVHWDHGAAAAATQEAIDRETGDRETEDLQRAPKLVLELLSALAAATTDRIPPPILVGDSVDEAMRWLVRLSRPFYRWPGLEEEGAWRFIRSWPSSWKAYFMELSRTRGLDVGV